MSLDLFDCARRPCHALTGRAVDSAGDRHSIAGAALDRYGSLVRKYFERLAFFVLFLLNVVDIAHKTGTHHNLKDWFDITATFRAVTGD